MLELIILILVTVIGFAVVERIMHYYVYFDDLACFICRSWFNQFKVKRVKETTYNSKKKIKFSFHDKCLKEFLLDPEKYKTERIIKINACINKIEDMIEKERSSNAIRTKAIAESQTLSKKLIWSNIQDGNPIEEFGEQK